MVINGTSGKDTYTIDKILTLVLPTLKNQVELKCVDAFKITNNSHVVFLTNNGNSI